jgi:hypothetical protein
VASVVVVVIVVEDARVQLAQEHTVASAVRQLVALFSVVGRALRWHDGEMRCVLLLALASLAGCAAGHAASPHVQSVAPTSGEPESMTPGGHDPEVVNAGKTYKLTYQDASARYGKGARCAGEDAPETVIGTPDQRNEMQQAHDKLVTYGYRFPQGTLLIRCRADHVEVQRTLK